MSEVKKQSPKVAKPQKKVNKPGKFVSKSKLKVKKPPKEKAKKVIRGRGRPNKYQTVEELEKIINKYFTACWTQKVDMFGKPVYLKDKKGKLTNKKVMVQTRPYTITGLAVALDTSRETLLNYEDKDDFFDTIKRAKQMCQQYAEESLFVGKNPAGAIFNLKNNYGGWRDKVETEHSGNVTWLEEPPK